MSTVEPDYGSYDNEFLDDWEDMSHPYSTEPSAHVSMEHVESRSSAPLRIPEPASSAREFVNRAMTTEATFRISGNAPPASVIAGFLHGDGEEEFAKIPMGIDRYRQSLTTEDYSLNDKEDAPKASDSSIQSKLTWDDSLDPFGENTKSVTSSPIREEEGDDHPTSSREESSVLQKRFRETLRNQQVEEDSKRRRIERVKNVIEESRMNIERGQISEEGSSTRVRCFDREAAEKDLVDAITNLRTIANKCLKEPKRGGNGILKRLQKETNMVLDELGEVMGNAPNDCFLCLFGNREFDKSTYEKVNGMYKILGDLLYKDATIRAIAIEMYAYYRAEIYNPGIKTGLCLPMWSSDGVEKHIRLLMYDPRIKSVLRLEKVSLAIDVLGTQATYYDEEDGQTKCDYVAMRLLHTYIKLEDDLQKRDFRTMMGYDESLSIQPGKAWLDTRINVTKKKRI